MSSSSPSPTKGARPRYSLDGFRRTFGYPEKYPLEEGESNQNSATSGKSGKSGKLAGGGEEEEDEREEVEEGEFVPATDLLHIPDLPPEEQINEFIDMILHDKTLNADGIPDSVERKVYKKIITKALEECMKAVYTMHGKEFIGHHVQLNKVSGRHLARPHADVDKDAIRDLAKILLDNKCINMSWLQDKFEEDLYVNMISVVLIVMQSFFASSKLNIIGHSLSVSLRPNGKGFKRLPPFEEGQLVEANYMGRGTWYEARIMCIHQQQGEKKGIGCLYDVTYHGSHALNGKKESKVKREFIRKCGHSEEAFNESEAALELEVQMHQEQEEAKNGKKFFDMGIERSLTKTVFALVIVVAREIMSDIRINFLGDVILFRVVAGKAPPKEMLVVKTQAEKDAEHNEKWKRLLSMDAVCTWLQNCSRGIMGGGGAAAAAAGGGASMSAAQLAEEASKSHRDTWGWNRSAETEEEVLFERAEDEENFEPERVMLRLPTLPPPEVINQYVDMILADETLNCKSIPDWLERKIYVLAITKALEACLKAVFQANGKEFLGHHIQIQVKRGPLPPLPAAMINKAAILHLVRVLLKDELINLSWVEDAVEEELYVNMITVVMVVVQSFLGSTKMDIIGHSLEVLFTANASPPAGAGAGGSGGGGSEATENDASISARLESILKKSRKNMSGTSASEAALENEVDAHVPKSENFLVSLFGNSVERPLFKTLFSLALQVADEITSDMKIGVLGDTVFVHLVPGHAPPKQTPEQKEEEAKAADKK